MTLLPKRWIRHLDNLSTAIQGVTYTLTDQPLRKWVQELVERQGYQSEAAYYEASDFKARYVERPPSKWLFDECNCARQVIKDARARGVDPRTYKALLRPHLCPHGNPCLGGKPGVNQNNWPWSRITGGCMECHRVKQAKAIAAKTPLLP